MSVVISLITQPLFAAEPFLAPPASSGAMEVKLYPTENVGAGQSTLVTFGVPFTRGSVTVADLVKVRVLKGTQEIAAHVDMLTPWRHASNGALDGQSVRIALVQIHFTFTSVYPQFETITVEWGTAARTTDVTSLENQRSAWHLVTAGTFAAADSVYEPDVFAVLPKAILCRGILRFPCMEPFADTIAETRDDPAVMAPIQHWPGNLEQMYAQKNFFYSIVNEDDVRDTGICHYKTDYEPWLFDRSSAMFVLYFRSGFFKPLREAVRAAEFYCNHLTASGFFDLKDGDDAKYSYNECLAYTHWLTGDDRIKQKISTAVKGFNGVNTRWAPTMNFWTERHSGFKLLANAIAYEVLGGAYKDSMLKVFSDLAWLQDGAGGQVPANRIDGGLYHYGAQHDWDWAEDTLGASPWMTMFVMDAVLRVYACTETQAAGAFITRMAGFLRNSCAVTSYNSSDGVKMDFPRYAILFDGRDGQVDEWSDIQHSMEVGAGIAYGYYLSLLLGTPDTPLLNKAKSLYATYDDNVNEWTRPAGPASFLPAYRVSPWRRYNWEYRPSGGFSWAIGQSASPVVNGKSGDRPVNVLRMTGISSSSGTITVNLAAPDRASLHLSIYRPDGRIVRNVFINDISGGLNRVSIDASKVPPGLYIVKIAAVDRSCVAPVRLLR